MIVVSIGDNSPFSDLYILVLRTPFRAGFDRVDTPYADWFLGADDSAQSA
jgi:hypothetical protein